MTITNKWDFAIWIALYLLLFTVVLAPILHSGFYNDDILNSLTFETVHSTFHGSLIEMIKFYSYHWAIDSGRLFPMAFVITYTSFYYLGWNPIYLKLISVFFVLLASLSSCRFVYRLTDSRATALLTLLILPITIQTRIGHDPILSYVSLLLISLLFIFEQAIAFDTYCKTGSRSALTCSLVLFVLGLLTYEVSMIAILLNGVVLLKYHIGFKKAVRLSFFHVTTLLLYLGIVLALRQNVTQVYGGVAIGSLSVGLKSFLINLYACLPFGFWLSDPDKIFGGKSIINADTLILCCLIGSLFLILWTQLIQSVIKSRESGEMKEQYQWLLMSGLILIIAPAILMALSARYQQEINQFGMAHLAGLIESFGSAMIFAIGFGWGIEKLRNKPFLWGISLAVGVTLFLGFCLSRSNHERVVTVQNRSFETWSRALFAGALRAGILETIPDGAILVFDRIPPWLQPELVPMFSGKHVVLKSMADANLELFEVHQDKGTAAIPNKVFFHVRWQRMAGLETCSSCGVVSIAQVKVLEDTSREGPVKKRITEHDLVAFSNSHDFANVQLHVSGFPVVDKQVLFRQVSSPLHFDGLSEFDLSWSRWRSPDASFADLTVFSGDVKNWGKPVLGATSSLNPDSISVTPYEKIGDSSQKVIGTGSYFDAECNGFRFESIANTGIQLSGFSMKMPFWISFWVKPTGIQLPNATIISNHANFKGITLEQDASADRNSYNFSAGIGDKRIGGGPIKIEPHLWSLVILKVDKDRIGAMVFNKIKTSRLDFPGTVVLGEEPLHLGKWTGDNRPFNGVIAEFEIHQGGVPQQLPLSMLGDGPCK
jgi:hypothetical protein